MSDWRDIDDDTPRDGTVILLHVPGDRTAWAGRWVKDGADGDPKWPWLVLCDYHKTNGLPANGPTKWQPLPSPPETENNG